VVDRSLVPTTDSKISVAPEIAPFTLFTQYDPLSHNYVEERLNIRAFYDTSILEVFVNERVAITTRIYSANKEFSRLTFFAQTDHNLEDTDLANIVSCIVWDGLEATSE
jgi:beta-fructofuranosidase